ncbi:hypothetical protein NDU88_004680 [Pleurodeles waltl]|uniref:Prolactin n=1 Tax=Pleurodeles waltl TaxID=8319 RepID=A0AAV7TAB5_PLEWA|nr:hypothetical protein NDU88_004680 [Pleurodeles waltl]
MGIRFPHWKQDPAMMASACVCLFCAVVLALLLACAHLDDTVKSLGISLDSNLTMQDHIKNANNAFISLKLLHKIKSSIPQDDLKQATQALVLSRLDYGISILTGTAKSRLAAMRSTLHAAARLVTGNKKYDHIFPALKSLKWLQIEARCSFRTACLTHKALHTGKPEYLTKKL